jgi:tetratricopeptide (TPR) repeat protein
MRPAEVNMSSYRSIGVGEMTGNSSNVFAGALEEALVKSERFQVVDRANLNRVMRELRLSASDLADPENGVKLGKQVTANALIFGHIDENYNETTADESFTDKNGVRHVIHKLTGEVRVSAALKVTDVSTGALVVAKTLDARRDDTNMGFDERPRPIDRDGLTRSARSQILNQFVHAIVPHKEYLDATFYTDGDLPQLETGIGYAHRGDWRKAQDTFNDAIQLAERNPKISTKSVGKAYWNLALSYEYNGEYDKALKMVDEAFKRTNEAGMLAEQDNIKRLQEEARKLQEQTGQKPAAEVIREK